MVNLFNYLLISNIFTGGFILFRCGFDFYIGYVFMILFLLFCIFSYRKVYITKGFIFILLFMSILSFLNIALGNDSIPALLKISIAFVFNGIVYYSLIRINNYEVEKLFRIYLKMACIIAVIGIFQEISFLAGFKYGYDYSFFLPNFRYFVTDTGMLKITSILPEPSSFGLEMAPAMFISVLNIIKKECTFISRKASFLIILSVLLSFSLVSYLAIVLALILIMLNYKKIRLLVACTIILCIFIRSAYLYVPDIRIRVNDTVSIINRSAPIGTGNLSTFAFCSNAIVAYKSFLNNPLFGSGLGSHPISYNKYITGFIGPFTEPGLTMPLNVEDAASLFFRLMSETGLLGIVLFFYFIVRLYVSKDRDKHFWIISNSIVCLFVMRLIRNGNYFSCGFIFFVWVYYFTGKSIANSINNDITSKLTS